MSASRIVALAIAIFFMGALALVSFANSGGDVEVVAGPSSGDGATPETPDSGNDDGAVAQPAEEVELDLAPPVLRTAPTELKDIETWLQADGETLQSVRGDVTILQFWTYSCHNCTATIPHLQDIYAEHKDDGLEIIGVHAPEFDFERDPVGVQEAADRLGVSWPIAIDNTKKNFRSWQESRRFWPRTYVIDQNGDIRFDKIGEGKYDELEATVAYLLENGA